MMQAGDYVNIGVSENPESRKENMQTGNPLEIRIIALMPFSSRAQAYNKELRLHSKLAKFRFRGEWFLKACIRKGMRHNAHKDGGKKRKGKRGSKKESFISVSVVWNNIIE